MGNHQSSSGRRELGFSVLACLVGLSLAAIRPLARAAGPVPSLRITPDWMFPAGWGVVGWDTDSSAAHAVLIRGTEPISDPHPRWTRQDVYLWDEGAPAPQLIYGSEAGDEALVSRVAPVLSGIGGRAVFGTLRADGHDLRRWTGAPPLAVALAGEAGAELDFPAIDASGDIVVAAEILPETVAPFVFRTRVVRWSPAAGRTVLVEHERRQIMGLDQSADGAVAAYAVQDFASEPTQGEIRAVTTAGSDQLVTSFVGLGGPVAVSDDGSVIAAFLSEPPTGVPDAAPGPAIWRFRGRRAPERLSPTGGRVPSGLDMLVISSDGESVSWGNILWSPGGGARRVSQDDLGSVDRPRLASGMNAWTAWLPDGPEGVGLYRMPIEFATPTVTPPATATPTPPPPAFLPAARQGG